ncbi:hypothetical protein B7463_g3592, partial [Scytalidium lignicola]
MQKQKQQQAPAAPKADGTWWLSQLSPSGVPEPQIIDSVMLFNHVFWTCQTIGAATRRVAYPYNMLSAINTRFKCTGTRNGARAADALASIHSVGHLTPTHQPEELSSEKVLKWPAHWLGDGPVVAPWGGMVESLAAAFGSSPQATD